MIKSIFIFTLLAVAFTHPTIHDNWPRHPECIKDKPPRIYSYHFHVVFDLKVKDEALAFRKKFAEFLNVDLRLERFQCDDIYFLDTKPLCFFDPDFNPDKGSPWMNPEWAILFLPKDFERIVSWGFQNRGNLDIVIHPNTGCDIADHTWYVLYGGNPRALDIEIFRREGGPFPDEIFKTTDKILADQQVNDNVKRFIRNHESNH